MVIFKKLKKHKMNIHMFIMNIINNLNNFINSNLVQAAHNKHFPMPLSRPPSFGPTLKHIKKSIM